MRGWHDRYALCGDIDAKLKTARVDSREMLAHKFCRLMGNVEINAVTAQTLHFMVDSARHDIAGREFFPRVKAGHEARAIGQLKSRTLTAQGFGNEE